ncbi:MAG: PepSY domain-containing protein [Lachnospiraceae bacterium]|nr:PepSY domain-containing protein [Lachnospiraceae bacterium]
MKQNKIVEAISNVDDRYINEAESYKAKNKIRYIGMIGMVAAACICLIAGIALLKNSNKVKPVANADTVNSVVMIDINPSIELTVNKQNKVVSAVALNTDAQIVLNDMDFKNVDLDIAMNAIIGSLLKNGYLDQVYNAVNICVEDNDTERANELGEKISTEISSLFDENDLIGGVNTQLCTRDEDIKELAKQYGVSVGKLRLAKQVAENMGMSLDIAVELSISELWDLLDAENADIISKEEALNIAVSDANVALEAVTVVSNVIKEKGGAFVYYIEFNVGENAFYKYKINAEDGFVIEGEYTYTEPETEEDNDAEQEGSQEGEEETTQEETTMPQAPTPELTKKEALAAACADAGVQVNAITLEELKHKPREKEYHIEFSVGTFDYKYIISAVDGSVISKNIEDNTPSEETNEIISANEALAIALEKAGIEFADLTKCDIKYTNKKDGAEYKVHFHVKKEHYEYTINAITGELVEKTHPTPPTHNKPTAPATPNEHIHVAPVAPHKHAGPADTKITIEFEEQTTQSQVE